MPPKKAPPLTNRDLLGLAALILMIAVAFEVTIASPDNPGRGILLVVIAAFAAAGLMLPLW